MRWSLLFLLIAFLGCDNAKLDEKATVSEVSTLESTVAANGEALAAIRAKLKNVQLELQEALQAVEDGGQRSEAERVELLSAMLYEPGFEATTHRAALIELIKLNAGFPIAVDFISEQAGNSIASSATGYLVRYGHAHPGYEAAMARLAALDLSDMPGGYAVRYGIAVKHQAIVAMYDLKPAEYVEAFLDVTIAAIKAANFDPSDYEGTCDRLVRSLAHSDRARKADYLEVVLKMYAEAFHSGEKAAGHRVMAALTGVTLGEASYREYSASLKLYQNWFAENREKLK